MEQIFQHNGQPASLFFSDVVGELSRLRYFDRGVETELVIKEFRFNEQSLKLTVLADRYVFYSDGTLVKSPEEFIIDATSQEEVSYFANLATPQMSATVKRMQVNGAAIEALGYPLFNTADGSYIGPPAA